MCNKIKSYNHLGTWKNKLKFCARIYDSPVIIVNNAKSQFFGHLFVHYVSKSFYSLKNKYACSFLHLNMNKNKAHPLDFSHYIYTYKPNTSFFSFFLY